MSKKSVADILFDLIFKHVKSLQNNSVSTRQAAEIQKKYIADACTLGETTRLPYLEIAQQLNDHRSEIFEAALFYLEKIAENHPQDKEKILEILQNFNQQNNRTDGQKDELKACISRISGI